MVGDAHPTRLLPKVGRRWAKGNVKKVARQQAETCAKKRTSSPD